MGNWSLKNKIIIVASLTMGSLVCVLTSNVFTHEAGANTVRTFDRIASLDTPIPQKDADSARIAEETLKADKMSEEKYNDRGVMYSEKGQYGLAIAEFGKALEAYPMSAKTYNNRGIAYSKNSQYDLAIRDFTKAIEIMPAVAKTYYNRGITYAIRRQVQLALLDLNKCLELDPMDAAAYDSRGSVLAGLACSDWVNACKLGECDHLQEAVKIGVCAASTDEALSSRRR